MTDLELRYHLLLEARTLLHRHWDEKLNAEKSTASFENRPHRMINPPTSRKVMKLAAELYSFVVPETSPTTPTPPVE